MLQSVADLEESTDDSEEDPIVQGALVQQGLQSVEDLGERTDVSKDDSILQSPSVLVGAK